MIKILCHPITKLLLFIGGFSSAILILRAINLTFDRAVSFAIDQTTLMQQALHVGVFYGQGFVLFAFLFSVCTGLLLVSVWKTKPKKQRTKPLNLWRNLDFFLLVILASLIALFALVGLRLFYAPGSAHFRIQLYEILGLPLIAYTAAVFTVTELVARIRDKDVLRTLYWLRFFRLYPVWKPLGLLLSLLLVGSVIVLVATTQEIVARVTFDPWPAHNFRIAMIPSAVPPELLLSFSLLTLISTTYFVTFALNLSAKYAEASAEKVRAEQFKSELITNVSHDIRTPLTTVVNYVDLLKKLPLEGDAAEYVSVLDRKADRLKMLIEDLIDASKAGTGNEEIVMQTVNLSEILGQIAGEFEDSFIAGDLTLVLTQRSEPVFINADNRHLWRVLENLFSNASKYALPGTRVFAEITLRGQDSPMFTLKNTSLAPLDLSGDALTEQFIRGDRARQSEGSGLGLYIAKNLVELMGGVFRIHITGDLFVVEIEFCNHKGENK